MNAKPNPARVAIVQDATGSSEQVAIQAVIRLDEYDTNPNTTGDTDRRSGGDGSGYASFADLLPVGSTALMGNGYSQQEAAHILMTVFAALAKGYGGKRLYLPKLDRIHDKFQVLEG